MYPQNWNDLPKAEKMAIMANQLRTGERKLVFKNDSNGKRIYPLLADDFDLEDYEEIRTEYFGKVMLELVSSEWKEQSTYWLETKFGKSAR